MCKRSWFISIVVLLTLSSLTIADTSQSQSSSLALSTEPVATNWAVSQYSSGESAVGTQTQSITVYTSNNNSDSPFAGYLPSSLLFGTGAQSIPALINGSILMNGLQGSAGLSAATQTLGLGTLPLSMQLSQMSALSGLPAFNPISGNFLFP